MYNKVNNTKAFEQQNSKKKKKTVTYSSIKFI